MLGRCTNPRNQAWSYYGGRGIRVCDRWRSSYAAFLADMGRRPSPAHSLDRYPNKDGNYEPGNVRWATRLEQARNTRRSLSAEAVREIRRRRGLSETVVSLAVTFGVHHGTVSRIARGLWRSDVHSPSSTRASVDEAQPWTIAQALAARSLERDDYVDSPSQNWRL